MIGLVFNRIITMRVFKGLLISILFLSGFVMAQQSIPEREVKRWSPTELWRGVDAEKLPLDAQVIKAWEEKDEHYEKLTYVSELAEGVEVRIFAIQGWPRKEKRVPGILHIHGGGQTASLAWVQYWVKRGYACVSYDFCGPWEKRTEYTDWGPLARNCNMASNVYEVHPTPRTSGWFHWALAGRRALTVLSQNPAVDAQRIGIFGISVGGTLCWLVAGSDARVKTAIPIYGCGYNVDRRKSVYGIIPSEDQLIYQESLTPEAHAAYIKCPVFFLSASNDHHGWMDDAVDCLRVVGGTTRQAFTPRYIHHIEPEQGRDMQPWMDWHLKHGRAFPGNAALNISLDANGMLQATVRTAQAGKATNVIIYYSLGMKIPPSRFWRKASVTTKDKKNWTATLQVMSVWDGVSVFGNVFYDSGICLSTELSHVIPGQLGKAKATLTPSLEIDDGSGGENWFFGPAYTDPNDSRTLMASGEDDGRHYISVNKAIFGKDINFTIASHIFGDPQFQGPPGASLSFDYKGRFDTNGLTITFAQGEWMPGAVNYKTTIPSQAEVDGWKTVTVSLNQFTNGSGASPLSWTRADRLLLSGVTRSEPLFSRFRWALPQPESRSP